MARNSVKEKASETRRVLMRGLLESHPEDAAEILERLPPGDCASVLAELPPPLGASVVLRMSRVSSARSLEDMPANAAAVLLSNMPPHAAAALIRCLDLAVQVRVILALSPQEATRLGALVNSLGGTVGALMDTRVLTVPEGASIREARELFRRFMATTSKSFYGYVVGSDQTIKGVLSTREMLIARRTDRLTTTMRTPVASIRSSDTPAAALRRPEWERLRVLPVVDDAAVLLGEIHHDVLLGDVSASSTASEQEQIKLGAILMLIAEGYYRGLATLLKGVAAAASQQEEEKR